MSCGASFAAETPDALLFAKFFSPARNKIDSTTSSPTDCVSICPGPRPHSCRSSCRRFVRVCFRVHLFRPITKFKKGFAMDDEPSSSADIGASLNLSQGTQDGTQSETEEETENPKQLRCPCYTQIVPDKKEANEDHEVAVARLAQAAEAKKQIFWCHHYYQVVLPYLDGKIKLEGPSIGHEEWKGGITKKQVSDKRKAIRQSIRRRNKKNTSGKEEVNYEQKKNTSGKGEENNEQEILDWANARLTAENLLSVFDDRARRKIHYNQPTVKDQQVGKQDLGALHSKIQKQPEDQQSDDGSQPQVTEKEVSEKSSPSCAAPGQQPLIERNRVATPDAPQQNKALEKRKKQLVKDTSQYLVESSEEPAKNPKSLKRTAQVAGIQSIEQAHAGAFADPTSEGIAKWRDTLLNSIQLWTERERGLTMERFEDLQKAGNIKKGNDGALLVCKEAQNNSPAEQGQYDSIVEKIYPDDNTSMTDRSALIHPQNSRRLLEASYRLVEGKDFPQTDAYNHRVEFSASGEPLMCCDYLPGLKLNKEEIPPALQLPQKPVKTSSNLRELQLVGGSLLVFAIVGIAVAGGWFLLKKSFKFGGGKKWTCGKNRRGHLRANRTAEGPSDEEAHQTNPKFAQDPMKK
eukprot:GHVT01030755.1.p1 GENE.GHVT01030755.1~~GHVT01030755.1.p1  ORF type:complete len:632 (+),score=82.57 GHVT01030755.1:527-2422(+)